MNLNTYYNNIWIPHESKTNKNDNTICFQWFQSIFYCYVIFYLVHDTLTGELQSQQNIVPSMAF